MRSINAPFVIVRPAGARIRTRLRVTGADEVVLRAVGEHLGHLASVDISWRCRLGQAQEQRTVRKRTLTISSSSRWAGSITRTSNNQWEQGWANLVGRRVGLSRAIRTIQARLAVPVGGACGRIRGYASRAERFAKQQRLQHLQAQLTWVDSRLATGRVSVCRGGRRLARHRHNLNEPSLSIEQWRGQWQAERWFLTADGDAVKRWGNETIRVHPDQHWLELRLPTPLAALSNTPNRACTYRLGCPVVFRHRGEEWAAQAATGAVRYDISFDSAKARWYLDASWRIKPEQPPSLQELRRHRALGIDLNADHLAGWILDPSGNPIGPPQTIPLQLAWLSASTRNGRLRAVITSILQLAATSGCRSIVIENLDFADARQTGRETLGRGRPGKRFRRVIAGIPTRSFRNLLVGMAASRGLWVIAVDPGWTSKWGRRYWQAPLNHSTKSSIAVSGHHAAAVVIARRGLGLRARRRPGVPGHDRRIVVGELPARPDLQRPGCEGPGPPVGQRAVENPHKTRLAELSRLGDQVVQDRSGPPEQDSNLFAFKERSPGCRSRRQGPSRTARGW
jgi:hypothetical protein